MSAIRDQVIVSDDLKIKLNLDLPLAAYVRGQDGYLWVELYDMTFSDYDDARIVGNSATFGDTYAGTGYDADIIREKVTALVEHYIATGEG